MGESGKLIDYTELLTDVPGEGLEEVTRQLGRRKGLTVQWSGRGADSGRDLTFTEIRSGPLSRGMVVWMVSCKDKAKSGDSVTERDLPSITDKCRQHGAKGFLLVTTTRVGTAAKALLDRLDESNGGDIRTLVWDASELDSMLLDPDNHGLLQQFLPKSYERVRGPASFDGALLALRDHLPEDVLGDVMRLVEPYSGPTLKGESVWPFNRASARAIDQVVRHLLIDGNLDTAVSATEDVEYDAYMAFLERLQQAYPGDCRAYAAAVVRGHHDADVRLNTLQFLFENWEMDPSDTVELAAHLDSDGLALLYGAEIAYFVAHTIYESGVDYDAWQLPCEMPSHASVDNVAITHLVVAGQGDRIEFRGRMDVVVAPNVDAEYAGTHAVQGTFAGFFNECGMCLESAIVDNSSLFR